MEKANEKKQYLLANYFGDNHYDDPFARQIEMLDSFNRSGVSTSKLQADLKRQICIFIHSLRKSRYY